MLIAIRVVQYTRGIIMGISNSIRNGISYIGKKITTTYQGIKKDIRQLTRREAVTLFLSISLFGLSGGVAAAGTIGLIEGLPIWLMATAFGVAFPAATVYKYGKKLAEIKDSKIVAQMLSDLKLAEENYKETKKQQQEEIKQVIRDLSTRKGQESKAEKRKKDSGIVISNVGGPARVAESRTAYSQWHQAQAKEWKAQQDKKKGSAFEELQRFAETGELTLDDVEVISIAPPELTISSAGMNLPTTIIAADSQTPTIADTESKMARASSEAGPTTHTAESATPSSSSITIPFQTIKSVSLGFLQFAYTAYHLIRMHYELNKNPIPDIYSSVMRIGVIVPGVVGAIIYGSLAYFENRDKKTAGDAPIRIALLSDMTTKMLQQLATLKRQVTHDNPATVADVGIIMDDDKHVTTTPSTGTTPASTRDSSSIISPASLTAAPTLLGRRGSRDSGSANTSMTARPPSPAKRAPSPKLSAAQGGGRPPSPLPRRLSASAEGTPPIPSSLIPGTLNSRPSESSSGGKDGVARVGAFSGPSSTIVHPVPRAIVRFPGSTGGGPTTASHLAVSAR